MNGLPKGFQPEFLIGKVVEMVCFTGFQLYLHLSGSCIITIEGTIAIEQGDPLELPQAIGRLHPLIGKRVESAVGTESGTLMLGFDQQVSLQVFDSNRSYESYSITEREEIVAIV